MESKQCTRCKKTLLLDLFKTSKRTGQYTKSGADPRLGKYGTRRT